MRLTNFRGVGAILTLIHTIRVGGTTLILGGDKRNIKTCNKILKILKISNHNHNHTSHHNHIPHNLLHQWNPCLILHNWHHNQHHNRHNTNRRIGVMRIMNYAWKSLIWNNNWGRWTLCLKILSWHNKLKGDSPLNPNKILSMQIALRKHMSKYKPSQPLGAEKNLIKSFL